jgi:hypothetical protein
MMPAEQSQKFFTAEAAEPAEPYLSLLSALGALRGEMLCQ